jgi:hypothetical protein
LLKYVFNFVPGDFVHDDIVAIVRNPDVTSGDSVGGGGEGGGGGVFLNDFWGSPMASNLSHKSYRPVTTLIFR